MVASDLSPTGSEPTDKVGQIAEIIRMHYPNDAETVAINQRDGASDDVSRELWAAILDRLSV